MNLPWPFHDREQQTTIANNWCHPGLGSHLDWGKLAGCDHFLFRWLKWASPDEPGLENHAVWLWVESEECVLFLPPCVLEDVQMASEICKWCLVWDKQMTCLCDKSSPSASGFPVSQHCSPVAGAALHWWELSVLCSFYDAHCMLFSVQMLHKIWRLGSSIELTWCCELFVMAVVEKKVLEGWRWLALIHLEQAECLES